MAWTERFSIKGKVALITGASSGIGLEIAKLFCEAGASVLATGRSRKGLESLADQVNRKCETIPVDVSTTVGCRELVGEVLTRHRRIDILVNSAGIARVGPAIDYSVEDWDMTMAVNLRAPFLLAQGFAPGMIEAGAGKIINISSQTGVIALPDHAAYAASKGGLNALTKSLMTELAPWPSLVQRFGRCHLPDRCHD